MANQTMDDGQTLADIMTPDPDTVTPGTSIHDAALMMADDKIGSLLVMSDGHLAGIVTDRDIVTKAIARGLNPQTEPVGPIASEIMVTATPRMSLRDAAALMAERQVKRLPVLDGGQLVGIVSMQDLAQATPPAVSGMAEQGITSM
jgi:CBS domain-containing protein